MRLRTELLVNLQVLQERQLLMGFPDALELLELTVEVSEGSFQAPKAFEALNPEPQLNPKP